MKYSIGDKVVHPMHGAGTVEDIKEIEVGGKKVLYYELNFAGGNMVTNIPVDNADKIGIRAVISPEEAKQVIANFCAYDVCIDSNWNKRQRDNIVKIKSGDIYIVLGVLKELMYREQTKGLSTSERKTMTAAKQIVVSEIVMSGYADLESVEEIMGDSIELLLESKK
ncbi:MAG: CarD family transcriptional regulator [bacterium]|nr:CarD family transcriptional regulator [bacterium]